MVIARYTRRARPQQVKPPVPQQEMTWKAIRIGALCAACAFAFFSFSQRNSFQRTGEALGPLPDSIQRLHFASSSSPAVTAPAPTADAKTIREPLTPQTFSLPESPNLTITEFNLPVTSEFQSVGHVDVRINGVNATTNSFDITVRTPHREFYRQDVKLAEHIPLSKDQAEGPEIVVGAISQNRVFGYVSEPRHRGHRRHRRRG